jgi:hypothetical protein
VDFLVVEIHLMVFLLRSTKISFCFLLSCDHRFWYHFSILLWFFNYLYGLKITIVFPLAKAVLLDHCPIQRCVSIPYCVVPSHMGACWHGDVDLEIVPRWHASTYMYTLLGCSNIL